MSAAPPRRRAARGPAPPRDDRRPAPHLVARSALADAACLVPPFDATWPAVAPRRPSPVRRRLAALIAAAVVVAAAGVAFAGTRVVLARFTDAGGVGSNTFATGTWAASTTWYLHNNPTPPVGNTTAQFNLPLNATAPTAATLYNYDTNCDSRVGRSINRNTGLVTEAGACRYATWRSVPLADARTLDGTARLEVWARKTASGGTNPTLRAFLRAFNPSTSTYTELGAADVTVFTNANAAWAEYDLTWSLANVAIPAGRRIEIKIVATGGTRNVEVAYDTNARASALTLP